ncbi:flagellar biosynthesis protein FlhB [Patulibacter sp. SYSU D01012]|uniref:flagellar biosynthesis protein FlhB n=1 Tax=Patulibacter sp. SYSU D01012 TaxID=2817381 RepID=UPI001B316FB1
MSGDDKTEEATPKRQQEAREKGQVARSNDLNGAVVLLVGLFALGANGPKMFAGMREAMRESFVRAAHPEQVGHAADLNSLATSTAMLIAQLLLPIAASVAIAAVAINLLQVRWQLTPKAMKPDFRKLNPLQGAKNVFGINAVVETVKSLLKLGIVAGVVAVAVLPRIHEVATFTGLDPQTLLALLGENTMSIAQRAAMVYIVIGAVDFGYQKHRHAKSLRMTKQEVKMEYRQQELPAEVRSQIRRRQSEASRARMMEDVATADVVLMNPTHFAVALRYDPAEAAPRVVAKGQDLLALKIRDLGREAGVAVVENPPLARALYRQVEVGHAIPEDLFQAVAEVLAFVFRMSNARKRSTLVSA